MIKHHDETAGAASLVVAGTLYGPEALIVCSMLAVVVWLAAAAIPQRSEDRRILWLGLAKRAPQDDARRDVQAGWAADEPSQRG